MFTILLALSAGMLGYFLTEFGKREFLRESEAAINIEIAMLSTLAETKNDNLVPYIKRRGDNDPIVRFRYESVNGTLIAGAIDPMPNDIENFMEGVLRFTLNTADGAQVFAAKIHTFDDGSRVIVARNVNELITSHETLKHMTWMVMVLMLAVVIVSFGISYFVVSRINRIAATAQNIIETGDLSQRLSIDSEWDDLSSLATVLNEFLEKIESLMSGIREVSNNIAHDLRTPLTGLRSDIEALKNQPADPRKIDTLLADADRILGIFHALLRIANIEKGKRADFFRDFDLSRLLLDVAELYEPVAEEKMVKLETHISPGLFIKGDRDQIFQMCTNILDNAIKFAPPHSVVRVLAAVDGKRIALRVEDRGQGIPDHEKDDVFKHFYRCDSSRSTPGNGLGLSLVQAVVNQHQAKIILEDANPGLCVRILF
ncbi:sensor histidine kinase [Micavibrio aeruginosavorus]|uniref:histidine kinase n=1 Tax=Micavibrio aeruginosavorus EPB TaxID=349215 RepID=M4VH49_9BACT|nr:HAMP domain-containing sensor histidine kinase [Micavibrio aeruginosavorus]AGH98712.1 Sensor protein basS/pmrB [Micavibrio aeruginosavorus EPB]